MYLNGKRYLVCSCERTMDIPAHRLATACGAVNDPNQIEETPVDDLQVYESLCMDQRDAAREALASTDAPVIVACRQQAPAFRRMAAEAGRHAPVGFVDIRDAAGWTEEAGDSLPKMAALLAAAAPEAEAATSVTLNSAGRVLVYGADESALRAAERLSSRLDVTLLIAPGSDVLAPTRYELPVYTGRIRTLSGHLGTFEVTVDGHATVVPSSRALLEFAQPADGVRTICDIVIDLTGGQPLLPGGARRHGYLRADPGNPAAVERTLFDAEALVGEFEKPVYVSFRPELCAHSRNGQTGCTRCLDACPLSAIRPDGDTVAIDAGICDGCGLCHAVCPTGAATYAGPGGAELISRLRSLLTGYRAAGGDAPVVLMHDASRGADAIRLSGRFGRGLPANVLPLDVPDTGLVGLDLLLPALAYGAIQVVLLVDPAEGGPAPATQEAVEIANAIAEGLAYGPDRFAIADDIDPDALEARLYGISAAAHPAAASFAPPASARDRRRVALAALHDASPAPVDRIALATGAPMGAIEVDRDLCTLCLACVSVCPTGAVSDNPDRPQLGFTEEACVQCGLCRTTCPEHAIALVPRVSFTPDARQIVVLNEEEPFECVRCGTPFGARATIEKMLDRLAGKHPMFSEASAIERLKMCGDCRVRDQFGESA